MYSSILIISSCGKKKAVQDKNQPTCKELETEEGRDKAKKMFSSKLTPARELYTGGQTLAIKKALSILKVKAKVDYLIISAGFGLVKENEPLPPYECSFSKMKKEEIRERAEKLAIPKSIIKLTKKKYDLVYLAIGKKYIECIGDLTKIKELGKEIILFTNQKNLPENYKCFTTNDFVGKKGLEKIFKKPIGSTVAAKGTILLNFAMDFVPGLKFEKWWEEKKAKLKEIEEKDDNYKTKKNKS